MMARLSKHDADEKAWTWAEELFAMTPNVECVWVRYEPTVTKGKRNRKSVIAVEARILEACRSGNAAAATEAMQSLSHLEDPGMAVCTNITDLTDVLSERLQRGECCFEDSVLSDSAISLMIWRE